MGVEFYSSGVEILNILAMTKNRKHLSGFERW